MANNLDTLIDDASAALLALQEAMDRAAVAFDAVRDEARHHAATDTQMAAIAHAPKLLAEMMSNKAWVSRSAKEAALFANLGRA